MSTQYSLHITQVHMVFSHVQINPMTRPQDMSTHVLHYLNEY
jgi:hypothetical protein